MSKSVSTSEREALGDSSYISMREKSSSGQRAGRCTAVSTLPGMNNKTAGTMLHGLWVGVCTHLSACVTESLERLKWKW